MTADVEFVGLVRVPPRLLGRDVSQGSVVVTADLIATYARAVGDAATLAAGCEVAPPTFCLALRRGFEPEVPLPDDVFDVHGGHDLEFLAPIRAGHTYAVSARLVDVYEKSGRSGSLTVIVREAVVREAGGAVAARIVERQIVRKRPPGVTGPG